MNLGMCMEEHDSYKNSLFYMKFIILLHGTIYRKGEKKIYIPESLHFSVWTNLPLCGVLPEPQRICMDVGVLPVETNYWDHSLCFQRTQMVHDYTTELYCLLF